MSNVIILVIEGLVSEEDRFDIGSELTYETNFGTAILKESDASTEGIKDTINKLLSDLSGIKGLTFDSFPFESDFIPSVIANTSIEEIHRLCSQEDIQAESVTTYGIASELYDNDGVQSVDANPTPVTFDLEGDDLTNYVLTFIFIVNASELTIQSLKRKRFIQ